MVDASAHEERQRGRNAERTRHLVVVGVGVVADEASSEAEVRTEVGTEVGQAAVARGVEFDGALFDLQRLLLDLYVMFVGVSDAVVQAPGPASGVGVGIWACAVLPASSSAMKRVPNFMVAGI